MQLSSADKSLFVKLVYYGPGLSGKTTNVESIHRLTDPGRKQPMVSLKTDGDRTLFFDLLPFDLGTMFGLSIRLKIFTVPGQIQYDTTRKQVLAGADGVVFVADSAPGRADANERMVTYLKANLETNGLDPQTIPLVFQWNKRDLPDAVSAAELNDRLNWRGAPALDAIATVGNGVIETFREISVATLEAVAAKGSSLGRAADATSIRERVAAQLDPFVFDPKTPVDEAPGSIPTTMGTVHDQARAIAETGDGHHREVLGLDALLQEAVQANMEMGDRLVGAGGPDALLARARRERKAIARLVQIARLGPAPEAVLKMTLTAALAGLDRKVGSILTAEGVGGRLAQVAVAGREEDPLNAIETPGVGSVAASFLDRAGPLLCHDLRGEILFGASHPAAADLRSVIAVPFVGESGKQSLLLVYSTESETELSPDDAELASLLTSIASLSLRRAAAIA